MLKGIDQRLGADMVDALRAMGHDDTLILCDTNFPVLPLSRDTVLRRSLSMDNLTGPQAAQAVLPVLPRDTFVDDFAARMAVMDKPAAQPPVQAEVQDESDRAEGSARPMVAIDWFALYDLSRRAFAVIQTAERWFYGCFMRRKGAIATPDATGGDH